MNVPERLKELIKQKGISIYSLSRETGIPHSTLSRFLNQKTETINRSTLKILADYFHVNLDWLITGNGEQYPSVAQQNQSGDNIHGRSVTVNNSETAKLLDIIKECHEILRKKDEQIDKLLEIINNK